MNTELNILKQISGNKGKASIQLIVKGLKMRNDYIRYLCLELIKKGLIKKLKKRDWYKITRQGEKEMGKPVKKSQKKKTRPSLKLRRARKKIKRSIKKAKKKTHKGLKQRPKRRPKKKPKKKPRKRPRKKLKKKVVKKKIRPKAKKKAKKKEKVSKSETMMSEKTFPLKEPEVSEKIETPTVSKANKITKIFKTLFGIKRD